MLTGLIVCRYKLNELLSCGSGLLAWDWLVIAGCGVRQLIICISKNGHSAYMSGILKVCRRGRRQQRRRAWNPRQAGGSREHREMASAAAVDFFYLAVHRPPAVVVAWLKSRARSPNTPSV